VCEDCDDDEKGKLIEANGDGELYRGFWRWLFTPFPFFGAMFWLCVVIPGRVRNHNPGSVVSLTLIQAWVF